MNDCIKYNACMEASNGKSLPCGTCRHYIPRPVSLNDKQKKMEKRMNKNLNGLADVLFEQLDRLNNDELSGDRLSEEIGKAAAICGVSTQIVNVAGLVVKTKTAVGNGLMDQAPAMLGIEDRSNG